MSKKKLNLDAMDALVAGLSGNEEETSKVTLSNTASRRGRKESTSKGSEKLISTLMDSTYYAKAQMIATQNKISVKAILNKALSNLIDEYEKKHGVVEIGKDSEGDVDSIF